MADYRLTRAETETILSFDDSGAEAVVYTCNTSMMKKLQTMMENPECHLWREDAFSQTYRIPKSWITIRPKRIVPEEQRQRMATVFRERMAKAKAGHSADE
jgi:hypothetical protein